MSEHRPGGASSLRRLLSGRRSFLARHRDNPVVRGLANLCRRYLEACGNLNYDIATNGEMFVLQTLSRFDPKTIIDVGANIGDWSIAATSHCPAADVHAFEITKPTWETLVRRTSHLPNVHCRPLGLSDAPGTVQIRYYEAMPFLTTAVAYPHNQPFTLLAGEVTTGDAYALENGVEHVDLLKIDVEGMEKQVLSGFDVMFSRSAIDVVQFEYGRVNILNHFLLRDAFEFFESRGFHVGKIYPDRVDFREYELADEDFIGPNYLACRASRADYLEALSRPRRHTRGPVS